MAAKRLHDPIDHLQLELAILARRSERVRVASLDVARSPLDRSGYLLLALLETRGEQTMSQLALAFDLDASTVTRQIAPLERRGFVERTRSTEDRRATIVSITDAGRKEREHVRQARITFLSGRLADWDEGDVAQLAELIDRFNQTLATAGGADRSSLENEQPK
ncbi:MarR family transcriptional regulator [Patulibacter sp. NPDC049589]|uniref:MarR family winged helix-turn-helix transcriptional regulator n=1 Tax=Patulibacter sp. NPDC049589 TaxID=3154731 RepID=UPI00342D1049